MLACGEIGLDINYFYDLTPRQFQNISEGYLGRIERSQRIQWEQVRYLAFWSTKQTLKTVSKPSDLIIFDWDRTTDNGFIDQRTPEEQLNDIKKVWETIDHGSTNS